MIDGNCGLLCNFHCCRDFDEDSVGGEELGIYLLPLEYEYMVQGQPFEGHLRVTRHTNKLYEMPPKIKSMYFVYCSDSSGCLREHRPIQCRTYPFEPHIENDELYIVVEQEQIHKCPLLKQKDQWRPEFIQGVWQAWNLLVTIPAVKYLVQYDSRMRNFQEIETKIRF